MCGFQHLLVLPILTSSTAWQVFRLPWVRFGRAYTEFRNGGGPRHGKHAGDFVPEPVYLIQVPEFAIVKLPRSHQELIKVLPALGE